MTRRTCRALCATRAWTMRRTTSRAPRATRRPAAARRTSTMQTTASPSTLAQGSAGSAARSRCAPAPHRRVCAAAPRPPSAVACRAHSMARRSVNARGRRSNAVARARRAGRRGGVRRHRRVRPVRALPAGHVAGQQPALPPLRVPKDRAQPGKPQARASGRGALPGRPARSPPALQQRTLWLGGARGSAGVYGEAGMREGGHVRWCRGMSGRTAGARKPWAQGRGQPRAATPLRRPRSAAAATCAPASGVVRCWEQGSPTAAFCLAGTLTGSARPRSSVLPGRNPNRIRTPAQHRAQRHRGPDQPPVQLVQPARGRVLQVRLLRVRVPYPAPVRIHGSWDAALVSGRGTSATSAKQSRCPFLWGLPV